MRHKTRPPPLRQPPRPPEPDGARRLRPARAGERLASIFGAVAASSPKPQIARPTFGRESRAPDLGVRASSAYGHRVRPALGGAWLAPILGAVVGAFGGCDRPEIPHPVSSTSDEYCKDCHSGNVGAPDSGHNRGKSDCTGCHDVTAWGVYPALMPHRGGDETRCGLCHIDGTAGADVTSHVDEPSCYSCHQAAEYGPWPQAVPHGVTSPADEDCLECHDDVDHQERQSCLACHES